MLNKIISLLKKESIKYIIIGGCTTAVNFIFFALLYDILGLELNLSNIIAISVSIIFAFFANKRIVFSSRFESCKKTMKEFIGFIGGRLITMILEIVGVWVLVSILTFNEYLSKIFVNIIVLILNFVISKFFVFKNKSKGDC